MREVNRERDSQLKAGSQENGSAHQRLAESQRSRRPVTKNPAERRRRSPRCNRCWPLQGINRSATWCSFTLDTFRAFIKIKSLLADGRALFDVAVAGPLTWLVFAISALLIGLRFSVVIPGNGGSSLDQAGLHRVIGPAGVSGQHVFGSIGARGHSRGDQRINPGREDVGYCPSRTLLCRGCECRTACFLSEDGSATKNPPNSQPAMISAMSLRNRNLSKSIETIKVTKNLIAITTYLLLLNDKVNWNYRFIFLFPYPQTIFSTIPTTKFLHSVCPFANSRKSHVSYSKTVDSIFRTKWRRQGRPSPRKL